LRRYLSQEPIDLALSGDHHCVMSTSSLPGLTDVCIRASAARYAPRRGICFVPIHDVTGSVLSVARRADDQHPLSADFIACALAVRDREAGLVDAMRAGTVVE